MDSVTNAGIGTDKPFLDHTVSLLPNLYIDLELLLTLSDLSPMIFREF